MPPIAYILLWFPKPSETFIFREVANLTRFGLPVRVYTLYGPWRRDLSQEMAAYSDRVTRVGLRGTLGAVAAVGYWVSRKPRIAWRLLGLILRQRGGGLEKGMENVWALLAAFTLAKRFEADGIEQIHASWASGPATAAWAASRLTGIPFTFIARAWDIHPPDPLLRRKLADAVFVRSETAANIAFLREWSNLPDGKFRLTYNGVPLAHAGDADMPMRPPCRLLAMGRLVRKKGFGDLLRAVRLLGDRGVDIRLTLVGDGPLRRELRRLARDLGVAERVAFTGFLPHDAVAAHFLASDTFVMPCVVAPSGDQDGIPTVILEALRHRLPVIATDVSGIPELIEDGVTGLLVPQRDPPALADAVQRMVADRGAALAMAEAGRDRVHRMFDPERNHRALLDLYRQVVSP